MAFKYNIRDLRPWRSAARGGDPLIMSNYHQVIEELAGPTRALREIAPDVWAGFGALHKGAVAEGVLPAKVKELMALAIAVVKQCDGCIAYHAKAAARRGATAEEVAEALSVALLMDGGTASVYGPRAWQAYQDFASPADASTHPTRANS
jgi:AhpD family alkylhydroperoxidase